MYCIAETSARNTRDAGRDRLSRIARASAERLQSDVADVACSLARAGQRAQQVSDSARTCRVVTERSPSIARLQSCSHCRRRQYRVLPRAAAMELGLPDIARFNLWRLGGVPLTLSSTLVINRIHRPAFGKKHALTRWVGQPPLSAPNTAGSLRCTY